MMVVTAGTAQTLEPGYETPPSVVLRLDPASCTRAAGELSASIEARVGTPTEMLVFFESSPDLRVSPASAACALLSRANPQQFVVRYRPGTGKGDAGGTWVRLRVVFSPDYPALLARLADTKIYPDRNQRLRLVAMVKQNQRQRTRQTAVTRFFPQ